MGHAGALGVGVSTLWLSAIVLLPLGAVVAKSAHAGFWDAVTGRAAINALELTLGCAVVVALVNAVLGTLTAWVLVRDEFPGKALLDATIDLPFVLPTIVAGLTLLALYGRTSPVGIDVAYTRTAIVLVLLFVTLPFVVRSVQPVVRELDREMEEAAASLGASGATTFRRVILPSLLPAILSGAGMSFARAVGEFGGVILISGNRPFDTEVSSVYIFGQIESDDTGGAAAVAVVLLAIALVVLLAIRSAEHWGRRRAR